VLVPALSLVLVVTMTDAPVSARPAEEDLWKPRAERSVPVRSVTVPEPEPDPAEQLALRATPTVTWPTPGATEVVLDTGTRRAVAGTAGSLPIRVAPVEGATASGERAAASTPGRVRVELKDRYLDGLLLDVRRTDGVARDGRVSLEVDYSGFRDAYGADWAVRLRLLKLPACALTTPERTECVGTPVATRNDGSGRLSAEVTVPGTLAAGARPTDGGLYAVVAAASSGAGDLRASPLAPSSTWAVGGSSGDFTWRYPMDTPPAVGGPEPELELAYSSGTVDGRTSATNNQPSWVGEGFDFNPGGYIERRYTSCGTDTSGGNNSGRKTGDLCWATDNAVFSLNGKGGELIRDDATGRWRPRVDDGSRVERMTGASNGDNDGEYWRITTRDGTQFYFGLHDVPGGEVSNSTWTVPVYGNHAGEPCRKSTFDTSYCDQAWRWNLDYVVDVHGNAMTLYYQRETNRYGRNLSASKVSTYHRGGWLDRIDYGQRVDDGTVVTPPVARVDLVVADRCIPGTTCTPSKPADWPDVPWDQSCTSSTSCPNKHTPTFWTQKRLAKVVTQVRVGSTFQNVESWELTHEFPSPGDGTRAGLWLDSLRHVGHVGGTASDPEVRFTGKRLNNRVDGIDGGIPPMNWFRLVKVELDSGGEVAVDYSPAECVAPDRLPTPDSNGMRCHPLRWTPEGQLTERQDWFHKYVVTKITETDRITGLEPEVTTVEYLTDPAWRHDEEDGLVPAERKTWSQWRGYGKVRTIKGTANEVKTVTESVYFRGMDGDRTASGGTKKVMVYDSTGTPLPDSDPLAGTEREHITYDATGEILERSITDPWISDPTATRTRSWGTTKAYQVEEARVRQAEARTGGGWQESGSDNVYDAAGRLLHSTDFNDLADPNDDVCTRYTYVSNEDAWLMDLPARVETLGVSCDKTPSYPEDLLGDERFYYDGASTLDATPVHGDITRKDELSGWANGAPTFITTSRARYDVHGRQVEHIDVQGGRSTTSYTPATGGPVTAVSTTNQLGHVTTTTLEPAWGEELRVTDPNGRSTVTRYDPLGRLTKVWQPGRDPATDSPSAEFSYLTRTTGANAVTIRTLQPDGSYETEYELYDGFMRPRQKQEPAPGGGRIVTDTIYDSRGLEIKENGPYLNDAPPGPEVVIPDEALLPAQTVTIYDHAERPVAEIFKVGGVERWRTTHTYGHNRHDIDPPDGETPTTRLMDNEGRLVELRQYHGDSPTGPYDVTRYTYTKRGQMETVTDPAGNVWRYAYDLRGRMVRAEDPDRGVTEFTYNDADEKVTARDARGVTLAYAYDALGRLTAIHEGSLAGPKRAEWTYDVLPDGTPARGQQVASTRYVDGNAYVTAVAGYDAAGRPTGTTYTIPASEGALAGTYRFSTTYHADGEVATLGLPAAGGLPAEQLRFGYDALGLPSTLTGHTPYVTRTGYTSYGELAQLRLSAGGKWVTSSYEYERGTHRLSRAVVERETAPVQLADLNYTYDAAGNVTRIADRAGPDAGGGPETQCFRQDYLRRLTEAWTPASGDCAAAPSAAGLGGPAPYWHAWTFDKTGNRLSETRTEANGATTTSTYRYPTPGSAQPHAVQGSTTTGPGGTRTDSYEYDATGNTVTRSKGDSTLRLIWDAEGRLAGTTGAETTSYVYDADGERLIRRDSTGTTLYLGDTELHLSTGGVVTGTRYYQFAGRTIAVRTSADNKLHWLALDHHGTPEIAIDATTQQVHRRQHTPYGELRGPAPDYWPGQRSFVGGTSDRTGLIHIGAREYDPTLGRFISVDPVIDFTDPQQTNGYAYANNSPVTYADPDGQWGFITRVFSKTVVRTVVHKVVHHVTHHIPVPVTIVKDKIKKTVTKLKKIRKKVVRKVKKIQKQIVKIKKKIRTAAKRLVKRVAKKVTKKWNEAKAAAKRARDRAVKALRQARQAAARAAKAVADASLVAARWTLKNVQPDGAIWKAAKLGLSAAAMVGCAICGAAAAGMTLVDMTLAAKDGNYGEAAFEGFGLVTFGLGRVAKTGMDAARINQSAARALAPNVPDRAARIAAADRAVARGEAAEASINGTDAGLFLKDAAKGAWELGNWIKG
jgi:RHS repeat-associated protein